MSQKNVVIIDYSIGNLFSVLQACKNVGIMAKISSDLTEIESADGLILPGVGAFSIGIQNLTERKIDRAILDHIAAKKPFFGICLGMQLLFNSSLEFGESKGLGVFSGTVESLRNYVEDLPIPKITWDQLTPLENSWNNSPFESISEEDDFYFVHSYFCKPKDSKIVLAQSEYGGLKYSAAILFENVFATQFHPEKSGPCGLNIYHSWKKLFLD